MKSEKENILNMRRRTIQIIQDLKYCFAIVYSSIYLISISKVFILFKKIKIRHHSSALKSNKSCADCV